ncbi:MAG: T9SS type A sorting domain-containing protein [Bacteroidota bacterium]|nr:T9SS type A sorting domain-containing protein [Bacteroidota bacterium]
MKTFLHKAIFSITLLCSHFLYPQCTINNVAGDLVISSNIIMTGTYNVSGKFVIPAGITVFVQGYSSNTCGKLVINAQKVFVHGTINANNSGYPGGLGGVGGASVTSITGDAVSLTGCNNKDNTGHVTVEGGKQGVAGLGLGGGVPGANGANGSGPKQQCLSNNDECGMIGSGGGAGGGSGGTYGGKGGNGSNGGNGTNSYTATGANVSTGYAVIPGNGGSGGVALNNVGTPTGNDIDLGSGGAGAGGGGRSFIAGLQGSKGGNGGGMVMLVASDTLLISGSITATGENGLNGGKGGDGGVTAKCCSDGCDDCGEATLSCGSGGGSGAGGGSGGGIYLESQNKAVITGTLVANGGNGGNGGQKGNGTSCNYSATFCGTQVLISGNGSDGTTGGGGGGGRIKIFVPSCTQNTISPVSNVSGGTLGNAGLPGSYNVICNVTSVIENYVYHQLNIFPNPATNQITLKFKYFDSFKDENCSIEIIDLNGKKVMETSSLLHLNAEQTIDVSELNSGMYFLRLNTHDHLINQKFIKQ